MSTAKTPFPTRPVTAHPLQIKAGVVASRRTTNRAVAAPPAVKKTSPAQPAMKRAVTLKAAAKALVKPGTKPAPKTAVKLLVKPALKALSKPAATQPVPRQTSTRPVLTKISANTKPEKTKKPKLVRGSFTIPKTEYTVLEELKQRANKLTRPAKKGELLRAGIKALAALSDAEFLTALAQVPSIKTGRRSTER